MTIEPPVIAKTPKEDLALNFIPDFGVNRNDIESGNAFVKYKSGMTGNSGIALLTKNSSEFELWPN